MTRDIPEEYGKRLNAEDDNLEEALTRHLEYLGIDLAGTSCLADDPMQSPFPYLPVTADYDTSEMFDKSLEIVA